jgi:hypothetical protein
VLAATAMVAVACSSGELVLDVERRGALDRRSDHHGPAAVGQRPEGHPADVHRQTGVTVDLQVTGWDAIRNKVAVAGAANHRWPT